MAVSRQQDYFEPSKLYTPSQLAQPRVLYDRESSAATCPGTAMAYPLLVSNPDHAQSASTDCEAAESIQTRVP